MNGINMNTEQLANETAIILGRVNGLHAILLTLLRTLPHETASKTLGALKDATEKIHADAIALPLRNETLDEMIRVLEQAQSVLLSASKDQ